MISVDAVVGLATGLARVLSDHPPPRITIGERGAQADNAPWGVPAAEVVLNREGYVLGYAPTKRIPAWVAYKVRWSDAGYDRRSAVFEEDEEIPEAVPRAGPDDYRGSGFDRGHLVSPRDIVFRGQEAVEAAFLMSAVAPQTRWLNQRIWVAQENHGRALVRNGGEVYVTAGPIFNPVPGSAETRFLTLGPNEVAVPVAFFRVLTRRQPRVPGIHPAQRDGGAHGSRQVPGAAARGRTSDGTASLPQTRRGAGHPPGHARADDLVKSP